VLSTSYNSGPHEGKESSMLTPKHDKLCQEYLIGSSRDKVSSGDVGNLKLDPPLQNCLFG
jgi:hypothetical protein